MSADPKIRAQLEKRLRGWVRSQKEIDQILRQPEDKDLAELANEWEDIERPLGCDLRDAQLNVHLGAAYLSALQRRFASWDLALTAYNRGPTAAQRARRLGRRPSSRYVSRVLSRNEKLESRYAMPARGS